MEHWTKYGIPSSNIDEYFVRGNDREMNVKYCFSKVRNTLYSIWRYIIEFSFHECCEFILYFKSQILKFTVLQKEKVNVYNKTIVLVVFLLLFPNSAFLTKCVIYITHQ